MLELEAIPVFCNVLWPSEEEALAAKTGDLHLVRCRLCLHFFNATFDPVLTDYTAAYENSLHFSDRFNEFARELAERLVTTYDLREKDIIEIGCGRGDFLEMLCRLGDNRGVGFDRSHGLTSRRPDESIDLRLVDRFLTGDHPRLPVDFVCCRHVLEHIADPISYLRDLRSWLGEESESVLYFEVPNARNTIQEGGIWDLIYEHCSYFSLESLLLLFRRAGFSPHAWGDCFGSQYLFVEARIGKDDTADSGPAGVPQDDLVAAATHFRSRFHDRVGGWRRRITESARQEVRMALWGSGSKGVTFLNLLDPGPVVQCVVDINPHKHGRFVAGTGHRVVAPEALIPDPPEMVVMTNPLYALEIEAEIRRMGIAAKTLST